MDRASRDTEREAGYLTIAGSAATSRARSPPRLSLQRPSPWSFPKPHSPFRLPRSIFRMSVLPSVDTHRLDPIDTTATKWDEAKGRDKTKTKCKNNSRVKSRCPELALLSGLIELSCDRFRWQSLSRQQLAGPQSSSFSLFSSTSRVRCKLVLT